MTINELATAAGVTTRTIRYYVEQNVLPPPDRGRPAEYTEEHLRLLDMIRRLKEQYLPLEEIRNMLRTLTPEQIERFLENTGPPPRQKRELSSATDYITHVLNRGALRSQLKDESPPPPGSGPSSSSAQPPPQAPLASPMPESPRCMEEANVTNEAKAAYVMGGSTWQRVSLAEGVELHYHMPVPARMKARIERLVEAARSILAEELENKMEDGYR